MVEVDLAVEKRTGFGTWRLLRAREVKERREASDLGGKREAVAVVERHRVAAGAVRSLEIDREAAIVDCRRKEGESKL